MENIKISYSHQHDRLFQMLAKRCGMGDAAAMAELHHYFRGKLSGRFRELEAEQEQAGTTKIVQEFQDFRRDHPEEDFYMRAGSLWLIRADLYGSQEASEILRAHPYYERYSLMARAMFVGEGWQECYKKEELYQAGFLAFSGSGTIALRPLSCIGIYLGTESGGSDGPDEDGFGREEYSSLRAYDEFFQPLKYLSGYSNSDYRCAKKNYWKACMEKYKENEGEREEYWKRLPGEKPPASFPKFMGLVKKGSTIIKYLSSKEEAHQLPSGAEIIDPSECIGDLDSRTLRIPEGMEHIEENAFRDCSLFQTIFLPHSLKTIGEYAFYNCTVGLPVRLHKEVRKIGKCAFGSCKRLFGFEVDERNPVFSSDNIALYDKQKGNLITYPNGKSNIWKSFGEDRIWKLPASVRCIKEAAFAGNSFISRITLPGTVKLIENEAFAGMENLECVVLEQGVREIGANCFGGCRSLRKIEIPASVIKIGEAAFMEADKLTICGRKGSYAERYARERNIPFVTVENR